MKLIPKDALVAEIERRVKSLNKDMDFNHLQIKELEALLSSLNTLEVKEVNLKKELEKEWGKFLENGDIGYKEVAKHFFELGLVTQVQSVWHDYLEPIETDKTILIVSPNGNSSLALWSGKELLNTTLGGGHSVLCKGDQWVYIEDLNKAQKGE